MTGENASRPPAAAGGPLAIGGKRGGMWIGAAAVASALCSLAAQLAFERALGIDGFAQWAYLTSLLGLLVPIACMGSNHLLLSEFFQGRLADRADASRLMTYFCGFSIVALGAFVELSRRSSTTSGAGLPLALLALLFLSQIPINLAFPVFQGRGQTRWVALWPLVQVSLRAALGAMAIFAAWSLFDVVLAWTALCAALAFVASLQILPSLRSRMQRGRAAATVAATRWHRARATLSAGLGFGLSDLLDALDLKLLVPLAALFFTTIETAAAGLCVVVLSAVFFFPYVLISRILLPAIHRSTTRAEQAEVRLLVIRLCAWSLAVLLPVTGLGYAYGYAAIARAVRGDYASQSAALSCLALCFAPLCVSQLAAAPHMQRARTWWLLRCRLEGIAVFLGIALGWRSIGLSSLVLAFAGGRLWLCARLLGGLRRTGIPQ